jgi:hypothetical protein
MDALKTVLAVDDPELTNVAEAWRDAFEKTPQGKPILLKGSCLKRELH